MKVHTLFCVIAKNDVETIFVILVHAMCKFYGCNIELQTHFNGIRLSVPMDKKVEPIDISTILWYGTPANLAIFPMGWWLPPALIAHCWWWWRWGPLSLVSLFLYQIILRYTLILDRQRFHGLNKFAMSLSLALKQIDRDHQTKTQWAKKKKKKSLKIKQNSVEYSHAKCSKTKICKKKKIPKSPMVYDLICGCFYKAKSTMRCTCTTHN